MASPLAVLYYERYQNLNEVQERLNQEAENIQCVVSNVDLKLNTTVLAPGQSQHPKLWDYADNVNTVAFLNGI